MQDSWLGKRSRQSYSRRQHGKWISFKESSLLRCKLAHRFCWPRHAAYDNEY